MQKSCTIFLFLILVCSTFTFCPNAQKKTLNEILFIDWQKNKTTMFKKATTVVTAIILTVLMSFMGCNNGNNETTTTAKKSTFNKVMETKAIKVGYIPSSPGIIKDPNTKQLSGIFYDVLMEAGRNLELKVEFTEELSWGTMIEAIKTDRVDMVCTAVWPTSQRGKQVDFTMPLYFSPVNAYVKVGNKKFDGNISALNSKDIKISTIDGEMTSIIAKFDFPNAQVLSMPQNSDKSQLHLNVATGKADVTFDEPVTAKDFMKNNPNKIQAVANVKPLRIFPNAMMIGKGETKFLSMLNTSFEELSNNGFIDKVIDKYEPYSNSFYRLALPYRAK